jgi:hypothetical protein
MRLYVTIIGIYVFFRSETIAAPDAKLAAAIQTTCPYHKVNPSHTSPFKVQPNPKSVEGSTKRRILFVGDSVMKGIVRQLTIMLNETDFFGAQRSVYYPVPSMECTSFFRNVSSFEDGSISSNMEHKSFGHEVDVCVTQASRLAGLARVDSLNGCEAFLSTNFGLGNVDLGDTMRCLTMTKLIDRNDILVINAGVHYNNPSCYNECIKSFLAWHSDYDFPCTFWRQTLPQHFPTRSGSYNSPPLMSNNDLKTCVPLATLNVSSSEQMQNDIVDKLMASNSKNITTIKLWRLFSTKWDEHHGWSEEAGKMVLDCTHWQEPARILQAKVVLDAITHGHCALPSRSLKLGHVVHRS